MGLCQGYTQKKDTDHNEEFSLIIKRSSIHTLLAMVVQFDIELAQLDVKMTFLHADLEDIYIYIYISTIRFWSCWK